MITTAPGKNRKILVIDDDPITLKFLKSILSSQGYRVSVAQDGPEAIFCAHLQRPDLILTDIFFPTNALQSSLLWDGFLIVSWLNTLGKANEIPIIIISAETANNYQNLSAALGARAFLPKPLDTKKMLATVRAALTVRRDCHQVSRSLRAG
ncbi:MAG TPA: response regulator [Verrucomicrobiae bacterium]|jgi:DNA-binding response OmpR family regulator|nr:response regulator [Verrucomicrobiae bacterium]